MSRRLQFGFYIFVAVFLVCTNAAAQPAKVGGDKSACWSRRALIAAEVPSPVKVTAHERVGRWGETS